MAANVLIFTLAGFLFTGCEQNVSPQNIDQANRNQESAQRRTSRVDQVKEGLTMKEVESILGEPAKVNTGKIEVQVKKDFAVTTWSYEQGGQTIELSFIDGKLQGRIPQFGEKLDPQAPLHMKKTETK